MDAPCLRNDTGITLTEILIATALVSTAFLLATSMHLTALRSLNAVRANEQSLYASAALETVGKAVALANNIQIGSGGAFITVTRDFQAGNPILPNNTVGTAFTTADDILVKFGVFSGRLYSRTDAVGSGSENTAVSPSDSEVMEGLVLSSGAPFSFPDSTNAPTTVNIRLEASVGLPARTVIFESNVTARAVAATRP